MPAGVKNPCHLCKRNVTGKQSPGLTCTTCNELHYINCVNLKKEIFESIKKAGLAWNCNACKGKPNTRKSGIFPPISPNKAQTLAVVTKKAESTSPDPLLLDLKATLDNLRKEFEDYKAATDNKITLLETQLTAQQKESSQLASSVSSIKKISDEVEKQESENFLTIQGIPDEALACPVDTVLEVGRQIGCKLAFEDFNCSSTNPRKKIIVVKFVSQVTRSSFYKAGKRFNRDKKRFSFDCRLHKIFVNEHLTETQKKLLYNTKNFAISNKFQHVWFCNGLVHLKRSDTSRLIVVKSQSDLDSLRQLEDDVTTTQAVLPERTRIADENERNSAINQSK